MIETQRPNYIASIAVWIGYLPWQRLNGYIPDQDPILADLHGNIRLMDAIMTLPSPLPSLRVCGKIDH
jgi:hypothetical protein